MDQFVTLKKVIGAYWFYYGGARAFFTSPLFFIALVLAILLCLAQGDSVPPRGSEWYVVPLDIIPSMLGFTLAAYAAIVAFGNQNFLESLSGFYDDGEASPFLKTNASFFHFILSQLITIVFAFIASKVELSGIVWAFTGNFLLLYSLLTSLGAAISVFQMSQKYDIFVRHANDKNGKVKR